MAHSCPECGMTCHCGTDIDDCLFDLAEDQDNCCHCVCLECGVSYWGELVCHLGLLGRGPWPWEGTRLLTIQNEVSPFKGCSHRNARRARTVREAGQSESFRPNLIAGAEKVVFRRRAR